MVSVRIRVYWGEVGLQLGYKSLLASVRYPSVNGH